MSSRRCRRHNGRRSRSHSMSGDAPIPPEPRLLGTAFASLLRELAAAAEVVVAIDDVQWLDAATATVTAFTLAAWVSACPRRVVDPHEHDLDAPRVVAGRTVAAARAGTTVGGSAPRDLHGTTRPLVSSSDPGPDRRGVRRNPFYALEIAHLLAKGTAASPLPVPSGVLALVRERIRTLPAESQTALLLVAAAARPELRFVDPAALAAGEEAGRRRRVRRRITFSLPLYSSAVYSAAPTARRREAHRRLASWCTTRKNARGILRSPPRGRTRTMR